MTEISATIKKLEGGGSHVIHLLLTLLPVQKTDRSWGMIADYREPSLVTSLPEMVSLLEQISTYPGTRYAD